MDHLLAGGIEPVDAVTHHQQVPGLLVVRHRLQHRVLEMGDVGEIKGTIEAQGDDMLAGDQAGVDLDIAQGAVRAAAKDGHPRLHGAIEIKQDG